MVKIDELVFNLHQHGAPREFVLLILMVIWTEGLYNLNEVYDWLEFFAGHAACTAWVRLRGFRGCKFDLKYADKANGHSSNYMDINSHSGFVLAIIFLLKGRPANFIAWFGIKCSSWTRINVGTSSRSACCSSGDTSQASVMDSNRMLERICLLLILTSCLGGVFILEQPGGSILEFYPTFRWVLARIVNIFGLQSVARTSWKMGTFGSPTLKPQYAYSNSPTIRKVPLYAPTTMHVKKNHTKVETARAYKNKSGKDCFTGTKHLKDTEIYPEHFACSISELVDDLRMARQGSQMPDPVPTAQETFLKCDSMNGSDLFDHADLASVFSYLRGCKSLRIPKEWVDHVPTSI